MQIFKKSFIVTAISIFITFSLISFVSNKNYLFVLLVFGGSIFPIQLLFTFFHLKIINSLPISNSKIYIDLFIALLESMIILLIFLFFDRKNPILSILNEIILEKFYFLIIYFLHTIFIVFLSRIILKKKK